MLITRATPALTLLYVTSTMPVRAFDTVTRSTIFDLTMPLASISAGVDLGVSVDKVAWSSNTTTAILGKTCDVTPTNPKAATDDSEYTRSLTAPTTDDLPAVAVTLVLCWLFIGWTLKRRKSSEDVKFEEQRLTMAMDKLAQVSQHREESNSSWYTVLIRT